MGGPLVHISPGEIHYSFLMILSTRPTQYVPHTGTREHETVVFVFLYFGKNSWRKNFGPEFIYKASSIQGLLPSVLIVDL